VLKGCVGSAVSSLLGGGLGRPMQLSPEDDVFCGTKFNILVITEVAKITH